VGNLRRGPCVPAPGGGGRLQTLEVVEQPQESATAGCGDASGLSAMAILALVFSAGLTRNAEATTPSTTLHAVNDEIKLVNAYWAAAERRDWEAFGALVADDVIYEAPQSRERVRGRRAYVRFNREGFPGEWHLTVLRVVGNNRSAASWIEVTDPDGTTQPGLSFFEIGAQNRITRITDFWPEPYEVPASRAHLVERY
jgi:SnoaL-like domain